MTHSIPSTLSQRRGARVAGYFAAAGAGGLALAHLTVYTIGFVTSPNATWAAYLTGGVAVSAIAAALAVVALVLARRGRRAPRGLLVVAWVGCALFTLQAAALLASGDLSLFGPDRPGTYSLVAGPAFGFLAWA